MDWVGLRLAPLRRCGLRERAIEGWRGLGMEGRIVRRMRFEGKVDWDWIAVTAEEDRGPRAVDDRKDRRAIGAGTC